MERLLIVDDEAGIRQVLHGVLTSAGYQVDTAESGEAALELLPQNEYDLLVVDLQMTGIDGLAVIERARTCRPELAAVILTGFATIDSAIWALHTGVDDYIVKPARPDTIRAAIHRALERRRARLAQATILSRVVGELQGLLAPPPAPRLLPSQELAGPLQLDLAGHRAQWHGQALQLTPVEFKLLAYLAAHAGQVLSPQALVAAVQGYQASAAESRDLIKPHIYGLRAKLEPDPAQPRYLINVRGVGYTLRLSE